MQTIYLVRDSNAWQLCVGAGRLHSHTQHCSPAGPFPWQLTMLQMTKDMEVAMTTL
jgi:hypothetical protein